MSFLQGVVPSSGSQHSPCLYQLMDGLGVAWIWLWRGPHSADSADVNCLGISHGNLATGDFSMKRHPCPLFACANT